MLCGFCWSAVRCRNILDSCDFSDKISLNWSSFFCFCDLFSLSSLSNSTHFLLYFSLISSFTCFKSVIVRSKLYLRVSDYPLKCIHLGKVTWIWPFVGFCQMCTEYRKNDFRKVFVYTWFSMKYIGKIESGEQLCPFTLN